MLLRQLIEVAVVAVIVCGLAWAARRLGRAPACEPARRGRKLAAPLARLSVTQALGLGLAAISAVMLLGRAHAPLSVLAGARQMRASVRAGIETCVAEDGVGRTDGFIDWLDARLPARAVYSLALANEPDAWCVTLVLLPRLPAGPGDTRPGWLIAFGAVPPAMQQLIDERSPRVLVYRPGFALERL